MIQRLIDKRKLVEHCFEVVCKLDKQGDNIAADALKKHILWYLVDVESVDAVPVVRCRECKHFRHYGKTSLFINGKNIKAGWCQRRISYDEEYRMTAYDFCSYGERKEGAD